MYDTSVLAKEPKSQLLLLAWHNDDITLYTTESYRDSHWLQSNITELSCQQTQWPVHSTDRD